MRVAVVIVVVIMIRARRWTLRLPLRMWLRARLSLCHDTGPIVIAATVRVRPAIPAATIRLMPTVPATAIRVVMIPVAVLITAADPDHRHADRRYRRTTVGVSWSRLRCVAVTWPGPRTGRHTAASR